MKKFFVAIAVSLTLVVGATFLHRGENYYLNQKFTTEVKTQLKRGDKLEKVVKLLDENKLDRRGFLEIENGELPNSRIPAKSYISQGAVRVLSVLIPKVVRPIIGEQGALVSFFFDKDDKLIGYSFTDTGIAF